MDVGTALWEGSEAAEAMISRPYQVRFTNMGSTEETQMFRKHYRLDLNFLPFVKMFFIRYAQHAETLPVKRGELALTRIRAARYVRPDEELGIPCTVHIYGSRNVKIRDRTGEELFQMFGDNRQVTVQVYSPQGNCLMALDWTDYGYYLNWRSTLAKEFRQVEVEPDGKVYLGPGDNFRWCGREKTCLRNPADECADGLCHTGLFYPASGAEEMLEHLAEAVEEATPQQREFLSLTPEALAERFAAYDVKPHAY